MFGGHDDNNGIVGEFLNSLERYDPSTNEWEEEAVAPMATARVYVGMEKLDGKLYAAGGESEADGASHNLVERYDFAANAWEAVTPMATARVSHAVAVLDGKLYAAGGHNDDAAGGHNDDEVGYTSYLTSVERYDPAANAWVGGGGADGGGAVYFRRGSARRQAVRCWRVRRRLDHLGGAVRPDDERVGDSGADGVSSRRVRRSGA